MSSDRDGFAASLKAAVARSGLTLTQVQRNLADLGCPVSSATLSYWRSGERHPEGVASLQAVRGLEQVLGLAPDDLVERLGPPRRPGPRSSRLTNEVMPPHAAVTRALEALDLGLEPNLVESAVHLVVEINHAGEVSRVSYRTVFRCLVAGTDRVAKILHTDGPEPPRISVVDGITVGRTYAEPAECVFGYELVLGRPLALGEEVPVEYAVEVPRGQVDTIVDHYFTHRCGEALLWVRFDPGRIPARCQAHVDRGGRSETLPLVLTGRSVHHRVHNIGPGRLGISWEW